MTGQDNKGGNRVGLQDDFEDSEMDSLMVVVQKHVWPFARRFCGQ